MPVYHILDENMDRLNKKMNRIRKKCEKYGCDFRYETLSDYYEKLDITKREDTERKFQTFHFYDVLVEGTAIVNDWEFVASLEHHATGNVVRLAKDIEVPERYYSTSPVCEHCSTSRYRKNTYLVHNVNTNEFKQVGKSCLQEFTKGLSAEYAASLMDLIEEMINGETYIAGITYTPYFSIKDIIPYAIECVNRFGYEKTTDNYGEYNPDSTRNKVDLLFGYFELNRKDKVTTSEVEKLLGYEEMRNFKAYTEENNAFMDEMIAWFLEQDADNNYMRNIQVLLKSGFCKYNEFGFIVSVVPSYKKHLYKLQQEQRRKEQHDKDCQLSQYYGQPKDKFELPLTYLRSLGFDGMYGTTWMHFFEDESGNQFVWKSSNVVEIVDKDGYCKQIDDNTKLILKGTVKEHNKYNGVKQTIITRCKVVKVL